MPRSTPGSQNSLDYRILIAPAYATVAALIIFSSPGCFAQTPAAGNPASSNGRMHTSPVAPNAPLPPIQFTAQTEQASPGSKFSASGSVNVTGGQEFSLFADRISGDMQSGVISASGRISLREIDTTITADSLTYNKTLGTGEFDIAALVMPPFMVMAQGITLHGDELDAHMANFSTCPPGAHQDYHVQAEDIRLRFVGNTRKIEVKNAGFYIGHTRVIEIKKFGTKAQQTSGQSSSNQGLHRTVGYDGHRGAYAVLGTTLGSTSVPVSIAALLPSKGYWSVSAATSTTLLLGPRQSDQDKAAETNGKRGVIALIRQFASLAGPPLPQHDPLLYHDYLGSDPLDTTFQRQTLAQLVPNATISYHEPLYGRRIGNLSYSRLPELAAQLTLPLSNNGNLPTNRNPMDVREALKKPYVTAYVTAAQGYYQEQPTGAKSSRTALLIGFDTRPLLLSANTLFRPRLNYYGAEYGTVREHYSYEQADLALRRSFSDRTALGIEYIGTTQHGSDPFSFDSIDTTQELDLRAQTGDQHAIYGGRLKFDLRRGALFDWQLVYGFPRGCYIPTITYDSSSGTIGFGINIPGVTF